MINDPILVSLHVELLNENKIFIWIWCIFALLFCCFFFLFLPFLASGKLHIRLWTFIFFSTVLMLAILLLCIVLWWTGILFCSFYTIYWSRKLKSCWIQWNEINVNILHWYRNDFLLVFWIFDVWYRARPKTLSPILFWVCCHLNRLFYMPLCMANIRDIL